MILEILSPEKKIYSGEASMVHLPGIAGQFELLNHHAPLISALAKGTVRFKTAEGEQSIEIGGGVVECLNNKVIICAE